MAKPDSLATTPESFRDIVCLNDIEEEVRSFHYDRVTDTDPVTAVDDDDDDDEVLMCWHGPSRTCTTTNDLLTVKGACSRLTRLAWPTSHPPP